MTTTFDALAIGEQFRFPFAPGLYRKTGHARYVNAVSGTSWEVVPGHAVPVVRSVELSWAAIAQ